LIHHAKTHGLHREVKEASFVAYFTQGGNVSDLDDLADVRVGIGLDRDEVVEVLTRQDYQAAVLADLDRARPCGIRSVPFFVIDNTYAVAGAQSAEALEAALERAWSDKEQVA
jgi:predicted DsbA family dithiol-disulfide isomerase